MKPMAEEFRRISQRTTRINKRCACGWVSAEGARCGMVDAPNLSGKRTEQKTAKLSPEYVAKNISNLRSLKWKQ